MARVCLNVTVDGHYRNQTWSLNFAQYVEFPLALPVGATFVPARRITVSAGDAFRIAAYTLYQDDAFGCTVAVCELEPIEIEGGCSLEVMLNNAHKAGWWPARSYKPCPKEFLREYLADHGEPDAVLPSWGV